MKSKFDFPLSLRWGFKDAKSWQTPIQLSPNLLKGLAKPRESDLLQDEAQ
jgi:hypothetical protein